MDMIYITHIDIFNITKKNNNLACVRIQPMKKHAIENI